MWVDHILLGGAGIELPVALWGIIEADGDRVHGLGDVRPIGQDHVHQLAVVALDRALTGGESVRLRPAQAESDADLTDLGVLIDRTRVTGHIATWEADTRA